MHRNFVVFSQFCRYFHLVAMLRLADQVDEALYHDRYDSNKRNYKRICLETKNEKVYIEVPSRYCIFAVRLSLLLC